MKTRTLILNLLSALTLAAASAQAAVVVSFPQPERYTDVGGWGYDPQVAIGEIERHLQRLGSRYLSPSDTLRIEVLDIDLAGTIWPAGSARYPVRIIRSPADWPRITLRYTFEPQGRPAESREETLTYNEGLASANKSESLHHEKRMLDEWFRSRFGK